MIAKSTKQNILAQFCMYSFHFVHVTCK